MPESAAHARRILQTRLPQWGVAPRAPGPGGARGPRPEAWRTAHRRPLPTRRGGGDPTPRPLSAPRASGRRRTGWRRHSPRVECAPCRSTESRPVPAPGHRTPHPAGNGKHTERSSMATAVRTMCANSPSSAAAISTNPGKQPRYAMSNAPAWVWPSTPTNARSRRERYCADDISRDR